MQITKLAGELPLEEHNEEPLEGTMDGHMDTTEKDSPPNPSVQIHSSDGQEEDVLSPKAKEEVQTESAEQQEKNNTDNKKHLIPRSDQIKQESQEISGEGVLTTELTEPDDVETIALKLYIDDLPDLEDVDDNELPSVDNANTNKPFYCPKIEVICGDSDESDTEWQREDITPAVSVHPPSTRSIFPEPRDEQPVFRPFIQKEEVDAGMCKTSRPLIEELECEERPDNQDQEILPEQMTREDPERPPALISVLPEDDIEYGLD
ncbi:dynein axonemal assembly factor 1-like [Discoglossus pictus]